MANVTKCKDKRFYWITYGSDSETTVTTPARYMASGSVFWATDRALVYPIDVISIGEEIKPNRGPFENGIYRVVFNGDNEAAMRLNGDWYLTNRAGLVSEDEIDEIHERLGPVNKVEAEREKQSAASVEPPPPIQKKIRRG